MENNKMIRKIKKLLSLSKSSNPHEAAKALEMAQKLMAENNINSIDIQISESDSKQKFARKSAQYVHHLAGLIEKAFGVEAYFSNRSDSLFFEEKVHAVFYGQEQRPVIACYCFDVLYRQVQRARKQFISTQSKRLKRSTLISRADNYCLGWVQGVDDTIKTFALTGEEKQQMNEYKSQLSKRMQKSQARKIGSTREPGGYLSALQGYLHGKQVKLNHGVNGQETGKLGVSYGAQRI